MSKLDNFLCKVQMYSYKLPTVKVGNWIMDFRRKHTLRKNTYSQRPYVEQSTICDTCDEFEKCLTNGKLVNITTSQDTFTHYIFGMDGCQRIMLHD